VWVNLQVNFVRFGDDSKPEILIGNNFIEHRKTSQNVIKQSMIKNNNTKLSSINMGEHHEHTEFLKHCLRYDDSPERHAMTENLTRLQRELQIVKRLARLMGLFIGLAGVGLAIPGGLLRAIPYHVQHSIMNAVLGLFAGSWVCLLTFTVLGIFLYKKLHRQREVCRQFLMRLFAVRLATVQAS
jgi:hypothetical protein